MLTFEQIKELIELVATKKLQNFELERAGFRLRVEGENSAPSAVMTVAERPAAVPVAAPVAVAAPVPAAVAEPAAEEEVPPGHILNSPIVGTFYRASSPDAAPFVEIGARVTAGQTICIVEAMKLFNEIESDVNGVIAEVYPADRDPIEFGQPLFRIVTD